MQNNSAKQPRNEPPVDMLQVRAAFILRGDSLHGWVKRQGLASPFVDQALRGKRRGPKARRIVAMVIQELSVG